MCYMLYLSTTSDEDLTQFNSRLIRFTRPGDDELASAAILKYPQRWFVGSSKGCSCGFRHLADGEFAFEEPRDWLPEEEDEIEATVALYRIIETLVSAGHRVDCLDRWRDTAHDGTRSMKVDLRVVSDKAFRLFENHHFIFECGDGFI
jgi:hypothetical protein